MGKKKVVGLVGEVCLYGAREHGFAYLARVQGPEGGKTVGEGGWSKAPDGHADGLSGTVRTLTEAVFLGCQDIVKTGAWEGLVRIYDVSGLQYADVPVGNPPYYGSMPWKAAA